MKCALHGPTCTVHLVSADEGEALHLAQSFSLIVAGLAPGLSSQSVHLFSDPCLLYNSLISCGLKLPSICKH
jgi:hypothetical protein